MWVGLPQAWRGGSHSSPFPVGPAVTPRKGGQGWFQGRASLCHGRFMGAHWTELPLRQIPEQEWEQRCPSCFPGTASPVGAGNWLSSALSVPAHVGTSLRSSPWASRGICASTKQGRVPAGSASPEPPFLITVTWLCHPPGLLVLRGRNLGHGAGLGRALSHLGFPVGMLPLAPKPLRALCWLPVSPAGRAGSGSLVVGAFQRILLALSRCVMGTWHCWDGPSSCWRQNLVCLGLQSS